MNRIKELLPEGDYKKLVEEFGLLAEFVAIHQNSDHTLRAEIGFKTSTLMPHSDTVPYVSANYPVYKNLLKKIKTDIAEIVKQKGKGKIKREKKDEKLADARLKQLGVTPRIYHFEKDTGPFTAITIADTRWSWDEMRRIIDFILSSVISRFEHERSSMMRQELRDRHIYGVAICDYRDQLNRQRGRTIAKGRLWKHLKPLEVEKENE